MRIVAITARCAVLCRVAAVVLTSFLALTMTVSQRVSAAGSDDYLKAIEAEGNRLEFLDKAKKEREMLMHSASTPAKEDQKVKTAQRQALREEFERSLSKELPGSYALYITLSSTEKVAVYNEYERAGSDGKTSVGKIRFLPAVNKIITSYNSRWSGSSNTRPMQ